MKLSTEELQKRKAYINMEDLGDMLKMEAALQLCSLSRWQRWHAGGQCECWRWVIGESGENLHEAEDHVPKENHNAPNG